MERIAYYLFDAPFLAGRDLRGLGNRARRELLEEVRGDGTEHIRFSTAFEGDPRPILEQACARGLEALIAKRADLFARLRAALGERLERSPCRFLWARQRPPSTQGSTDALLLQALCTTT
jgi:hypothetical protein